MEKLSNPLEGIDDTHQSSNAAGAAVSAASNPWKKPENVQQPAFAMDTLAWPALSLSSRKATPDIELPESSKTTMGFSEGTIPVVETAEIAAAKDSNSSSSMNLKVSVSVDGYGTGSEQKKVVSSSSSFSKSTHSRPAPNHSVRHLNHGHNQNHHHYHSTRPGSNQRGNGFNGRGGNRGGDGFQNQNYPNRRHHPRGVNNWNYNRGFNSRVVNSQHQPHGFVNGPAGFLGPPPNISQPFPQSNAMANPPYVNMPPPPPPPPPVPGYMLPFGYYSAPYFPVTEASTPLYCPPVPEPQPYMEVMSGPPPYIQPNLPLVEVDLPNKILKQIEYYFSEENLVKDHYLRGKMDDEGWVSVHLIAGFPRVISMTSDISLILRALESSDIIEIQGDKLRKRGNWMAWIQTRRSMATTQTCSYEDLLPGMQNMHLDGSPRSDALSKTISNGSDASNELDKELPPANTG